MKQVLVLLGCAVFLAGLVSCQNTNNAIEVIIDGDGRFHESLAGRWRANEDFWEIQFEPDGTISSAIISMGGVKIIPGKTTRFPSRGGGEGVFKPGKWLVQYSPDTRQLMVKVVVEHFYIQMGTHALEGNLTDILTGPVSEDGTVWSVEWYNSGKLIAYIPEPNEFHNQPEPEWRGALIFEKVKNEDL